MGQMPRGHAAKFTALEDRHGQLVIEGRARRAIRGFSTGTFRH